ncbi:hypothetical protein [Pseudonocardia alaniniphila]|uniref:Uncharacterized protein n=1 Tax=Pseudonocardia alaniniphila TaxID=75291 RepID=A0ABS9T8N1_9PSEU|nr:hypothetical protein [Pseudonocardia alaniniphila]
MSGSTDHGSASDYLWPARRQQPSVRHETRFVEPDRHQLHAVLDEGATVMDELFPLK